VAVDYFAAVTMRDADALHRLFAPDATLVAEGTRHQGTETIARFYREGAFHFDDLLPHPRSFRVEGNQVVVEIDLHIAGTSSTVVDTFEIEDGRIRSLVIQGLSDQVRSRLAELTSDERSR
jgi:ketosteroid isomerase-like protein